MRHTEHWIKRVTEADRGRLTFSTVLPIPLPLITLTLMRSRMDLALHKLLNQSNRKFVLQSWWISNDYRLLHSDANGELQDDAWELKLHERSQQFYDQDQQKSQDIYGFKTKENFFKTRNNSIHSTGFSDQWFKITLHPQVIFYDWHQETYSSCDSKLERKIFLESFLPDVVRFSEHEADVVVADNASADDSISWLEAFTDGKNHSIEYKSGIHRRLQWSAWSK